MLMGVGAPAAGGFWAGGMNLFFNEADFNAAPAGLKTLASQATLAGMGISDTGSTNGTYFDAAGVMRTKTGNEPRLTWLAGLLDAVIVEPAATNLCPYNTQVGGTGWTAAGTSGVTNTFQTGGTAPDGITNWTNTAFNGSADDRLYDAAATVVDGAQYTISIYVYADGPRTARLGWFDTDLRYSTDIAVGTGITRISWTGTMSGTTAYPYVANRSTGGAQSGLHFWGMQLEAGAVATSFVRNAGAGTVTRTTSEVLQATTSIPSFTELGGTFTAKFDALNNSGANPRVITSNSSNWSMLYLTVGQPAQVSAADATPSYVNSTVVPASRIDMRAAYSYSAGTSLHRICGSGGVVGSNTFSSSSVSQLKYGGAGSDNRLIGRIKRLAYSATVATDAQLQAISAGTL